MPGGTVFRMFDRQDSGCVSYGVDRPDGRWFVKTATTDAAAAGLRRSVDLHRAVRHPAVVPLVDVGTDDAGRPVLTYPWVDGEVLYHPRVDHRPDRRGPDSAWSRFRAQPVIVVETAIADLLDAHLALAGAGFVVGDFYDGCLLWGGGHLHLVDLDEYRPGPFVADFEPSGSRRFMAPEEHLGGTFDERTTVYALGRAIRLLLDAGDDERAWRGTDRQLAVATRAIERAPEARYPGVRALITAWASAGTR